VTGRVDDTVELPVATTKVLAGSVLRAEDVRMARVHMTVLRGEVVRRPDDAIGMQAKRQIAAGQPLVLAELARPGVVGKGAVVLMVLDSPGIALTAQGQATEAGAIGERIRVLNPVSRAVVEAEVIGPNRVRVVPGAMPVTVSVR
jgi:flagella basal body P-ring formation protein FlgA